MHLNVHICATRNREHTVHLQQQQKRKKKKNTQPKQQQMKCPKDLRQNAAVENNELNGCLHTRITVASH